MAEYASKLVQNCALRLPSVFLLALFVGSTPALAQSINFTEVSDDPAMGLSFDRSPSYSRAAIEGLQQASLIQPVPMEAFAGAPHRTGGFPGIAMIDHDGDGDLDVYVSNGPGASNSLFSNQLDETGQFSFIDVGPTSGADATSQDSNGVCFGDVDNDGDEDLLVLGRHMDNRLHLNDGAGQFTHVPNSGLEGGTFSHIGCSLGDINGDGLVDVVVANAFDLATQLPLIVFPYSNEPNQLFENQGGGQFVDVSASSGILQMDGLTGAPPNATTITWTVTMVDVDQDGDMDILHGDDQGPVPEAAIGGVDRAFMHVFINDGTGHFVDEVVDLNDDSVAAWMGLDLADLDHDGELDFFGGNFGDYMAGPFGIAYNFTHFATRPHFGNGDGTFVDPGSDVASAFSWGLAVADLDNDGDHDATYHGSLDMTFVRFGDNPGIVMVNDGTGAFDIEIGSYGGNYSRRGTQGVAAGDLNGDGFIDIVTAAEHELPYNAPLFTSPLQYGSVLDTTAFFTPQYFPDPGGAGFIWAGYTLGPGHMTMEINNADSGNESVRVSPKGSVGITGNGRHNRSGLGAIVTFDPTGHQQPDMMQPVSGGSSFLSQHETVAHFGMGNAHRGTVDVLWNGGHRNRLYWVHAGDDFEFPEIGCSYDTTDSFFVYLDCLDDELDDLEGAGVVSSGEAHDYFLSMAIAYLTY